ncbi:hypothetical protein CPB83DRAFT_849663 [Crepidotus variabilis]|uniref:Uncharacterized protein n=1 Tax=Crepidotus variabilis TaxID=179855 RepID=A0A9P6EK66_9AGAR|nr:hypothetical protein CPB83DRAFT_849663 [Crepidotus variabilis]
MYIDTYPVIPFSVLLLQKLQAWDDRQKKCKYMKQYEKRLVDLQDLNSLFRLGEYMTVLRSSKPWRDRELFSADFHKISKRRVRELCRLYPEFAGRFRSIGFSSFNVVHFVSC